jgi:hypothetical protein
MAAAVTYDWSVRGVWGVQSVKVRTSARAGLDRITRVPLRLGHEDHQVRCDWIGRGGADLSVSSV